MAVCLLTQRRLDEQPSAQMRGNEQQFKPIPRQSFLHQTRAVLPRFLASLLISSKNIPHNFQRKTFPQPSPKENLSKWRKFTLILVLAYPKTPSKCFILQLIQSVAQGRGCPEGNRGKTQTDPGHKADFPCRINLFQHQH